MKLPPLLVADQGALRSKSYAELNDLINSNLPVDVQATDHDFSDSFDCKFNVLNVNGTALLPFNMIGQAKTSSSEFSVPFFEVYFSGEFSYKCGNRLIGHKAGRVAGLVSANELHDTDFREGAPGISVSFSPDSDRLDRMLQTMSDDRSPLTGNDGWLDQSRELPMQQGNTDMFASFSQLIRLIQSVEHQPQLMTYLALDDALYRHAALMLRPDLFFNDRSLDAPRSGRLDDVCDYMQMHVDKALTLTELESVSGLSARTLQYGFQKRFGCTPLQWLSNVRLDQARRRLLNPDRETNVTRVALDAGFSNPGNFARKYFERFGELPSHTLSG